MKEKTNNISDLQQVTKRAYFTFQFDKRVATYLDKPEWELVKDRLYLDGNVQHDMLEVLEALNPKKLLSAEPLTTLGRTTELGRFVTFLYYHLFRDLLAENKIGVYLEDHKVSPLYQKFLYSADSF